MLTIEHAPMKNSHWQFMPHTSATWQPTAVFCSFVLLMVMQGSPSNGAAVGMALGMGVG